MHHDLTCLLRAKAILVLTGLTLSLMLTSCGGGGDDPNKTTDPVKCQPNVECKL